MIPPKQTCRLSTGTASLNLLIIFLCSWRIMAQALLDTSSLPSHPSLDGRHIPSSPPTATMKYAPKMAHIEPSSNSKFSSECHSLQTVPCHDLQPVPLVAPKNCEELEFCDDIVGFEAIQSLHRQLDDDANGDIDISESDEFLRDELKYGTYANERQKAFHGNDKHVTVEELWRTWKVSAVHNWSVEETVDWLCNVVELPQYKLKFELNAVDGIALPRLAANPQFFNILGINNNIHRQKISLKATDVVLFGVPRPNTLAKDLVMCGLVIFAVGVGWYAYMQNKHSQTHLKKMMKDMEALSSAEKQLNFLQLELDKTKQEHENAFKEKRDLELKLKQKELMINNAASNGDVNGSEAFFAETRQSTIDEQRNAEMEAQLIATQDELMRYKTAYAAKQWIPPLRMQACLQFTYEMEIKNYNAKKASAELQMRAAREEWDKLKKKGATIFGVFRAAHGTHIDSVDNTILNARTLLAELTREMQERIKRWNMIESFCGFDIIHNPGYANLEKALYGATTSSSSIVSPTMSISSMASAASSMAHSSSYIFPRNTSETTLVDSEHLDADSASILSGYTSNGNSQVNQPLWHNSVPMQMRRASANIYTNYPSPLSSPLSSTVSEQFELEEDFTVPSNNGKGMYKGRILAHPNEALIRSKTLGMAQLGPVQQKLNALQYFRRGSSDGVEKHFEEQPMPPLVTQSECTLHRHTDLTVSLPTYDSGNRHGQCAIQQFTNLTHHGREQSAEDSFLSYVPPQMKKTPFELNEDHSSSSESTLSSRSGKNGKSVTMPLSDLAVTDNAPTPQCAPKKRHFFAIRKRKSSKNDIQK